MILEDVSLTLDAKRPFIYQSGVGKHALYHVMGKNMKVAIPTPPPGDWFPKRSVRLERLVTGIVRQKFDELTVSEEFEGGDFAFVHRGEFKGSDFFSEPPSLQL